MGELGGSPECSSAFPDSSRRYAIIFTSNQAGQPSSQLKFQRKVPLIGAKLNVPFHCFAAHGYDEYRKPGTGMWDVYVEKYNGGVEVNVAESIYVGDAAGRPRKGNRSEDHSDVDRSESHTLLSSVRSARKLSMMLIHSVISRDGSEPRRSLLHARGVFSRRANRQRLEAQGLESDLA